MEYRHSKHHVYLLNYHLVWCPKRRRPVLVGAIKMRLEQILRNQAEKIGVEILALEIMPDHIHVFVSSAPKFPVHKIVRQLKGLSSHILREEFPKLLKLPSLWTHSYFVSSAGNVSSVAIKKYIEAQGKK